ncbi:MAG: RNA polymerase sigma factor RpoD/SigA, partial [Treponema sp.]|nr:RNA polymerase sigma factor RpoD/SigA [Treponema sp.]
MNDSGPESKRRNFPEGKKRAGAVEKGKKAKPVKSVKETDPLALYFKQISRFPLLTVQDEQNIGEKIVNIRKRCEKLEAEYSDNKEHDFYIKEKGALDSDLLFYKNRMINS